MFTKLTGYISKTAMTGLMVASIGSGLLISTAAAHAGPLDDSTGAANVTTVSDSGSHTPITCSFEGQVYLPGETRTEGNVSFYCMPNGNWATVDPGGPAQPKTPRQLKGVVSLMK